MVEKKRIGQLNTPVINQTAFPQTNNNQTLIVTLDNLSNCNKNNIKIMYKFYNKYLYMHCIVVLDPILLARTFTCEIPLFLQNS